MPDERETIDALIERVVRDARIRDPRAREELRRELRAHFEDVGTSPEVLRGAIARFGSPDALSEGLRRAYGRGRTALYVAKVMSSIAGASAVALAVELVANLRFGSGRVPVRVGDGYAISAWFAIGIVLLLVAAWELDVEPLCARLERHPVRLAATFGALFAGIYVAHPAIHGPIDVGIIVAGSSAGLAVWACTVAIVARLDLAFAGLLGPREE